MYIGITSEILLKDLKGHTVLPLTLSSIDK